MTPVFRILADRKDITDLVNDRLLQLKATDKPDMDSDSFELRIDDRDGALALPKRGANIEIFLGYAGQRLTRIGLYTVDEVEWSGPPDVLVIRGRASDFRGSGKTTRSGSWEDVPLSRIVSDIAQRNGWKPVCGVATEVPRADHAGERRSAGWSATRAHRPSHLPRQNGCRTSCQSPTCRIQPLHGKRAPGDAWAHRSVC